MRDPTIATAIAENEVAYFSSMGRLPGARLLNVRGALLLDTGATGLRRVLRTQFKADGDATDDLVTEVRAILRDRPGPPLEWVTGFGSAPADLPDRLATAGFALRGSMPAMAREISSLPDRRSLGPGGLSVRRVRSRDEFHEHWVPVLEAHFGRGSGFLAAIVGSYEAEGFGADARFWHLAGSARDGDVEVIGTALLSAGALGIHTVATLEASRGRGLGSAMTVALATCELGSSVDLAVLHATRMGFPVYRRLGFETSFEAQFYVDAPPTIRH